MKRSLAPAAVLLLALCAAPCLLAQNATNPQPLPNDPVALLKLAWEQNGLHGSDLKPWHVRATWTEVDPQGNSTDSGTWEEWWAGENKWKVSYASGNSQQMLFMTDHGVFATGSSDVPKWNFSLVQQAVNGFAPDPQHLSKSHWHNQHEKRAGVEITCATNEWSDQYCFAGNLPVLRICTSNNTEKAEDSLVRFQGRYLARKVRILQAELPEVDIAVDQIESISSVVDSDFLPPKGAVPAASVLLEQSVLAGERIGGDPPEYPSEAKFERRSGVVWIEAIVQSDGSLNDLHVLGGPPIFHASAMKATKTWRYKPYLLDGKPVAVRTRICVVYRIGQ